MKKSESSRGMLRWFGGKGVSAGGRVRKLDWLKLKMRGLRGI